MSTAIRKFASHAELAHNLQKEVDAILSNATERDIYAEFRERDIVEIENGVEHHITETALDERINYKLNNHKGITEEVTIIERTDKTIGMISRFAKLLFKPFEW
jgi:hypothetical protein